MSFYLALLALSRSLHKANARYYKMIKVLCSYMIVMWCWVWRQIISKGLKLRKKSTKKFALNKLLNFYNNFLKITSWIKAHAFNCNKYHLLTIRRSVSHILYFIIICKEISEQMWQQRKKSRFRIYWIAHTYAKFSNANAQ